MKNQTYALLSILMLTVLTGCTEENTGTNSISQTPTSTISDIQNTVSSEIQSVLKVLPERCIACKKCYNIDPEHFAPTANYKAVAISQENLDSSLLKKAIRHFPTNAIIL